MTLIIVGIVILIVTAGFFSGTETGLISVNRIHLQQLVSEDDRRARRIKLLLRQPNKAIIMFLIGTNLSIVSSTALATYLTTNYLPMKDGDLSAFIASCVMTPTLLIFSEIFPKVLFRLRAETLMYRLSALLTGMYRLMLPIIHVFSFISSGLIWLLRGGRKKPGEDRVDQETVRSREDLRLLIKLSEKEGILEEDEERMIYSVFDFGTMSAREVMTPRVDVVAAEQSTSLKEIVDIFIKGGHSRMPIYKEDLDHIVGIFNAFDVLNIDDWNKSQTDFMREAMFVPETKKVASLLQEFQKKKTHMAVVVDEYGGTAGLVTLEDILEEIVGEIEDEFDKAPSRIRTLKDESIMVDGRFSLHDLNDDYDLDLPTGDEVDSIGGFLEHEMGRLPDEGDELLFRKLLFTVKKADGKRVMRVRIRHVEAAGDQPDGDQEDWDESERH